MEEKSRNIIVVILIVIALTLFIKPEGLAVVDASSPEVIHTISKTSHTVNGGFVLYSANIRRSLSSGNWGDLTDTPSGKCATNFGVTKGCILIDYISDDNVVSLGKLDTGAEWEYEINKKYTFPNHKKSCADTLKKNVICNNLDNNIVEVTFTAYNTIGQPLNSYFQHHILDSLKVNRASLVKIPIPSSAYGDAQVLFRTVDARTTGSDVSGGSMNIENVVFKEIVVNSPVESVSNVVDDQVSVFENTDETVADTKVNYVDVIFSWIKSSLNYLLGWAGVDL